MNEVDKSTWVFRYFPLHVIILLWIQYRFYRYDEDIFEPDDAYKILQDIRTSLSAHTLGSRLRTWLTRRLNSDIDIVYRWIQLNVVEIGFIKKK